MHHCERRRRLAGAAGGEITEADHRYAGGLAVRLNAPPRHRAINGGKGREQAAATLAPPEGGLAHHSMIPKSGYRFSDKIMRILRSSLLQAKLDEIRIERGKRAIERAAEFAHGFGAGLGHRGARRRSGEPGI